MKILAIETSCDETGITILEIEKDNSIHLLGNVLASQIELHAQYGGVFPAMAKRAHAEKFTPLLVEALDQASLLVKKEIKLEPFQLEALELLAQKESVLKEALTSFIKNHQQPDIDYIAVTTGPGLEPALWVGVNAARVLSQIWSIPFIPINHMEGHVVGSLFEKNEADFNLTDIDYPGLALLVSGGHTELVLIDENKNYQKIGQTRDDAVGEAFDKVARMLGLSYPGGPQISALAQKFREKDKAKNEDRNIENKFSFPRPMLHSGDYDFSFSGIKTAVLYTVKEIANLNEETKEMIASEFENAVVEVLVKKTFNAIREYNVQTLIVGGGVAGNTFLKIELEKSKGKNNLNNLQILFPQKGLSTDNAVMIGLAACLRIIQNKNEIMSPNEARADGNLSITDGGFRK